MVMIDILPEKEVFQIDCDSQIDRNLTCEISKEEKVKVKTLLPPFYDNDADSEVEIKVIKDEKNISS